MSASDNHRRRSHRSESRKKAAFGNMTRKAYFTPAQKKRKMFGLAELFKAMRMAKAQRAKKTTEN